MPDTRVYSVRTNRMTESVEIYDVRNGRTIAYARAHVTAVRIANAMNCMEERCTKQHASGTPTLQ